MMDYTKWQPSTRLLAGLLLLCAVGAGCTHDDDTVDVQVCGDFVVPDDLEAVRVHLLSEERENLHGGVRRLLQCPEDRIRSLPQTVSFRQVDEDIHFVEVVGIKEGVTIARSERRIEERGAFSITLSQDCRGMQCSLGQTCIRGQCEWTPSGPDEDCIEATTDATDAGIDADTEDFDADRADANDEPPDAGDLEGDDAGTDEFRYCPDES